MDLARILRAAGRVQLPAALLLVALLVANAYLGLGLDPAVLAVVASLAGALGVQRPSDLAAKLEANVRAHLPPDGESPRG